MRERHCEGLGVHHSSDIFILNHENNMFSQGVLGEESSIQLLRTVIYVIGMHCALWGGVEHTT